MGEPGGPPSEPTTTTLIPLLARKAVVANDPDSITLKAEQVLHEAEQKALPVDLTAIAAAHEIGVVAKDDAAIGVSGVLIRVGDQFTIAYSTRTKNDGHERFSVGHELGHYFLDGHVDHVISADGVHESRAGHVSRDPYEVEADRFSAALLMPHGLFRKAAHKVPDGLAGVEQLAKVCRTSLTATAIRYADYTADEIFAVVVSLNGKVEFCTMSKRLKELPNVRWPKRDDPVPSGTATYRLIADPRNVLDGEREAGTPHLHHWFTTGPDITLEEEVVGLGRFGRVLTILTASNALDDEEAEEEVSLIESWTPKFSRSRRR